MLRLCMLCPCAGVNVGAIVGPIIAVLAVGLAAAGFLLHRRRKAFAQFAGATPTSSDGGKPGKWAGDSRGQASRSAVRMSTCWRGGVLLVEQLGGWGSAAAPASPVAGPVCHCACPRRRS